MLKPLLALVALAGPTFSTAGDPDTDRDGLSDFQEIHKYLTDPRQADSDGDGIPDGDWGERREYNYTVHAVMHVLAPYDVASMNDDYQDVRVLDERDGVLEFEVVVYPFNRVAEAIEPSTRWSKPAAELKAFVAPGVCSNWDKALQAELLAGLAADGVELDQLDDAAAARAVSSWLMERSEFEDSITTFAVDFEKGRPEVSPRQAENMAASLTRLGRTLAEQFDRELYGKGMFENRVHGSCTSSAIYLSTGLKAAGLPTRTVVCVPLVDANDGREVSWIDQRLTHLGLRAVVARAAEEQRGKWASHTFNEVHVGGRWRRLNYTQLGQNVLDPGGLGLMVHVHTFNDHSEAGLSGWGNREAHPLHGALFGGPNPYSCIGLSDAFGVHSQVPNEPLSTSLREGKITQLYWYEDSAAHAGLKTDLGSDTDAGYFFVHYEAADPSIGARDCSEFWNAVDKEFVLRAQGQPDVPAQAMQKYWVDLGKGVNDFIVKIEAADYAHMRAGIDYELVWEQEAQPLRWTIAKGLRIARKR